MYRHRIRISLILFDFSWENGGRRRFGNANNAKNWIWAAQIEWLEWLHGQGHGFSKKTVIARLFCNL
jgi:hypothetical protein